MLSKNAKRKKQKLERTETALKKIKALVGSPEYVEQTHAILEKSKLPPKKITTLETDYHVPQAVHLPELPPLSPLQQQLLGKATLSQLLGFELTEKEYGVAGGKTALAEWYAYGYTLYVSSYNRLRERALNPTQVEQKEQALPPGPDSIEARIEVNQYLNAAVRSPGLYFGVPHYQKNDFFGPISFLIDMPQPFLGKLVLASVATMVDSLTQAILNNEAAKTPVQDLKDIPWGYSREADTAHLIFRGLPEFLRSSVRMVTFPTLPREFISQFNDLIHKLPAELQVANQDNECNLTAIYLQYYNHLGHMEATYDMNRNALTFADAERLGRLPLTEFYLDQLVEAFFSILQAAQTHLLPTDEQILDERAKMASAVSSSSSSSSSSSILPRGISAGQLSAAYASPLPPTDEDETAKIETAFRPQ